ncbi:MAG TPA: ATP-binding protein, partial [Anaerolineaceae bacterium]
MDTAALRKICEEECRLEADRPLVVGVSGGADSLCLALALAELGYSLVVAHFDHQLRPESGADARAVEAFAARHGLPCVVGEGDVSALAREQRLSLEEAARKA